MKKLPGFGMLILDSRQVRQDGARTAKLSKKGRHTLLKYLAYLARSWRPWRE
jgi:hypothetical protein